MGHPDRKLLREKKKQGKEKALARRNAFNVLDLTPHNALGKMRQKDFEIKYR